MDNDVQSPEDRRLARFLERLRQAAPPAEDQLSGPWPEGEPPNDSASWVVVDGLDSRSAERSWPRYSPWLGELRTLHSEATAVPCELRGLSYSEPGRHYAAPDTNIWLLSDTASRFGPYAPSVGTRRSYIAFSVGGPLTTLGLGHVLRQAPGALDGAVTGLVLVQPAFRGRAGAQSAFMTENGVPGPVLELMTQGAQIEEEVEAALILLRDAGAKIRMLYWKDDPVLEYSDDLLTRLEQAGVTADPLSPQFPRNVKRPFPQHCAIRSLPQTREWLLPLLRELSPCDLSRSIEVGSPG